MVGWLKLEEFRPARGEWTERVWVKSLPLLCARVYAPPGVSPRALARRTNRAARRLAEAGCRRVLLPEGFEARSALERRELIAVEPGGLCRAMAADLALALLEKKGIPPRRAAVELRGARAEGELSAAAYRLCPRVRQVTVRAQSGGEALAAGLRRMFGAAALTGGGMAGDAAVCFTEESDPPEGALRLWGARPETGGFALRAPEDALLPGADPLALAALLWEEGRLGLEEIALRPGPEPLDRGG